MRRAILPIAIAVALLSTATAGAAVTCSYDSAAHQVLVTLSANGDHTTLDLLYSLMGSTETFRFSNNSATMTACGAATTNNTSQLVIFDSTASGSGSVTVDDKIDSVTTTLLMSGHNDSFELDSQAGAWRPDWVIGADTIVNPARITPVLMWTGISSLAHLTLDADLWGSVDQSASQTEPTTVTAKGGSGAGGPWAGPGTLAIRGSRVDDTFIDDAAPITYNGNIGDDTVIEGGGNDTLTDDAGEDTIDYSHAAGALHIDLSNIGPQATGLGTQTLSGFEHIIGANGPDVLRGGPEADWLEGKGNNDVIEGGGGDDKLDGGDGTDTVTYANAPSAVTASLADGASSGGEGHDALIGFEDLTGSFFSDHLTGGAGFNTVVGGSGDDSIDVRDGGSDGVACGNGNDTVTADALGIDGLDADCETVGYPPLATIAGSTSGTGAATTGGAVATVGGPTNVQTPAPEPAHLVLTGTASQRAATVKAIVVSARCPLAACALTATAKGTLAAAGKKAKRAGLALKAPLTLVRAKATTKLRLTLTAAQRKTLAAHLKSGQHPKILVTVHASDALDVTETHTLTITLRS